MSGLAPDQLDEVVSRVARQIEESEKPGVDPQIWANIVKLRSLVGAMTTWAVANGSTLTASGCDPS